MKKIYISGKKSDESIKFQLMLKRWNFKLESYGFVIFRSIWKMNKFKKLIKIAHAFHTLCTTYSVGHFDLNKIWYNIKCCATQCWSAFFFLCLQSRKAGKSGLCWWTADLTHRSSVTSRSLSGPSFPCGSAPTPPSSPSSPWMRS